MQYTYIYSYIYAILCHFITLHIPYSYDHTQDRELPHHHRSAAPWLSYTYTPLPDQP